MAFKGAEQAPLPHASGTTVLLLHEQNRFYVGIPTWISAGSVVPLPLGVEPWSGAGTALALSATPFI